MKRAISLLLTTIILFTTGCTSNVAATKVEDTATTSASATANTGYNKYFQGDKIIDIKINLPQEDYQDMLDNAEDEQYKSADINFDGTVVENVGFRTKGNLTLRSVASASTDSDRYSFRIKLDKYVDGQSLDGLDEFVINNMYSDSSYLREYLSYEALRSIGIDTPQCVFANIYINDELKGLYLCIEAIDDSYIERVFLNTDGNLYKAEMGSSLVYMENDSYDSLELKMGTDTEKTGLKNMISILNSIENGNKGSIEDVLDVDSALKYIAFNYVFSNYDSYQGHNRQNYYLYENNGVFSVIPWDFNMSFGGSTDRSTGTLDMPVDSSDTNSYPLVTKLLSVEEYKEKYYNYVKELIEYCNTAEDRISTLKKLIYDAVEADPTKFCTTEDFEKATTYSETENANEGNGNNRAPSERPDDNMQSPPKNSDENMTAPPKNGEEKMPVPQENGQDSIPVPPDSEENRGNGRPDRPGGTDGTDGNRQTPPKDFESDKDNSGHNGQGGKSMMHNNSSSIVNFIRNRIDTVNAELSKI